MIRTTTPRRHADGSLDIDYYRRRATRLRRLARRQGWVRLDRALAAFRAAMDRRPAVSAVVGD